MTRKEAKKILGKYGSLEVTWYKFDCGQDGCGECKLCEYLSFLDYANSVAPSGSTIQYDEFIDNYLELLRRSP